MVEKTQQYDAVAMSGEVSRRYQVMQQEVQALISRIMEIDDEKKENELVLESIMKLEDDRKCWRLINGVLFEKTKAQVVPEMTTMIKNLANVSKQLNDALLLKKQDMNRLEQQYDHIMKQAKMQK
mmetsp:Transcript_75855/g.104846  ORF Transcript_75855/g.104846 Transcript_75855/m.104846 type:complete len:125 (+) Transcript_75855:24-398(+)